MRSKIFRLFLAVVLCVFLNGCVSIVTTLTAPRPYGGVQMTGSYLVNTDASAFYFLTAALVILDFPLTAVMDTLLLPVTLLAYSEY